MLSNDLNIEPNAIKLEAYMLLLTNYTENNSKDYKLL